MAPRSPWRDIKISIRFGSELPPLRHDPRPTSLARLKWRPVGNHDGMSKPIGGLWTAPALLPEGKWRPIPRRSTWTRWCEQEGMHMWVNYGWQTQIFPDPAAPFAVIDTGADAAALYQEFRDDGHPLAQLATAHGTTIRLFNKMIDWQRMLSTGIAGVYLTERGEAETRLPEDPGVPSLYGWDLPTTWFGRKAYRVGKTWKSPRIPVEPEDDLPPRAYFARNRERLEAYLRETEEDAPQADGE